MRTISGSGFIRFTLRTQLMLLVLSVATFSYTPQVQRSVKVINPDWKFIKQDIAGASAQGYSEASMRSVNLPHSFDIPYWRANAPVAPYIGWYRKHFTVSQAEIDAKLRFFIEFDGVYNATTLYANGTYVGLHKGGFTGFSFDITKQVVAGDNVLAVRVNGTRCDTIAPATGEFIFIGGIYRNVYLVKTNPLHVTWYGTFVTTPEVTTAPASAKVKMKTEIKNDGASAANCRVKTIVVDSTGNEVASFESTQSIDAGATANFVQTSPAISNVNLWSTSSPYMYTVYTEVYSGTTLADNFKTPLGIRTIKWTTTNGFELNGKRLWLQGANVHQDRAGWAYASTDAGQYRDIKILKDCGMNFARGSHYPHSPAFSDACDKLGLCLWSESVFWGFTNGGYADNASFKQSCLDQTREMVRIHRNHPSVIMWSMGNEVWFTSPQNLAVANVAAMIAVAHAEDSTRPAGIGGAQQWTTQLGAPSDVVGWNGGGSENGGYTYSKPMMISEYGSCIDTSWVDKSTNFCWNREGDGSSIKMSGDMPEQPPYCGGISLWCAFHHGSMADAVRDPFPGGSFYGYSGLMGLGTHARVPLQRYYKYREKYLGTPLPVWPVNGTPAKLRLTADRTTITDDGTIDVLLTVQVQDASGAWLLNSPSITLTDASGKGSFPDTSTDRSVSNVPTITFRNGPKVTDVLDKGVRNGEAGIEFRSYSAGTAKIVATSGTLAKDSVIITVTHVPDPGTVFTSGTRVVPFFAGPQEVVAKSFGSRVVLPKSLWGKKVMVSLFDVQGRLIEQITTVGVNRIVRPRATEGVVVAKVRVVR